MNQMEESIKATVEGLTLVTDPATPRRQDNSVCDDSTPDLTFAKTIKSIGCLNTQHDRGNDHYIIEIQLNGGPDKRRGKQLKLVDWMKFKKTREKRNVETIRDIDQWTANLKEDISKLMQVIPQEAQKRQTAGSRT
ncbi:hypothetical protein HPB49_007300 [Dermacentor silvarum]|uniref:Uncharacterized protein n=1 Tax=Dermacentor silvarum TaxID=543639 RepID=A0ACB8CQE2_DERSI|nr:hypothetical protein HPB49_007300 [Dermacentor silvarum]